MALTERADAGENCLTCKWQKKPEDVTNRCKKPQLMKNSKDPNKHYGGQTESSHLGHETPPALAVGLPKSCLRSLWLLKTTAFKWMLRRFKTINVSLNISANGLNA